MILVGLTLAISCGPPDTADDNPDGRERDEAVAGALRPCPGRPSYWEYQGRCQVFFGASDRDSLFQWTGSKLINHLDLLVSVGGNLVRNTMNSREYMADGTMRWDLLPYPFAKVGEKYDLNRWNAVYWDRLRQFLEATRARGIIVQLELWDMWNESGDSENQANGGGWFYSPWNPNNNLNYGWGDSPLLARGVAPLYNPFHRAVVTGDPVLLPYQRAFVRKVLDETLPYGNVLYQIDNESGIELAVGSAWASFARSYAASKGRTIYVTDQRRFHAPAPYVTTNFRDFNNPEIRVPVTRPDIYGYLDISQNGGNSGQTHYDNIVWYRSKVLEAGARPINATKTYYFNWPTGTTFGSRVDATPAEAGAKLWRTLFAGAAAARFHRHTHDHPRDGFGLSPDGHHHLRSLRAVTNAVDFTLTSPRNDLLASRTSNEAYCVATSNGAYAVFFTGEGDRSVGLALDGAGTMKLRWLDVDTAGFGTASDVVRGGTRTLTTPGSGQWVAVLTPGDASPPPPPPPPPVGNLISNAGFEAGAAGWRLVGTGAPQVVSGGARGSASSLRITADGTMSSAVQVVSGVVAGATYTFSATSQVLGVVAEGSAKPQASLRFKTETGAAVGSAVYLYAYGSGWNERSLTVVPPAGAVAAEVRLFTWQRILSGEVLFDDIVLTR